jgi:hypothetical protein
MNFNVFFLFWSLILDFFNLTINWSLNFQISSISPLIWAN